MLPYLAVHYGNPSSDHPYGQNAKVAVDAARAEVEGRSPGQLFWMRFRQDKVAMGALVFLVLLVALALLAPVIADKVIHHGPNDLFIHEPVKMVNEFGLPLGPNEQFWFGADRSGRDLFVRVIYGARSFLVVGVVATGIAVFIGSARRRREAGCPGGVKGSPGACTAVKEGG